MKGGGPARQEAAGETKRGGGEQEDEGGMVATEERGRGWRNNTGVAGGTRAGTKEGGEVAVGGAGMGAKGERTELAAASAAGRTPSPSGGGAQANIFFSLRP